MSSISAGTTSGTALVSTGDTTGTLDLKTGASATTALSIDASQNVGIGTSSPSYKLDVVRSGNGTVSEFSNGTSTISIYTGATSSFVGGASLTNCIGFDSSLNASVIKTNNTERLYINSSGNLGLGVTPSTSFSGTKAFQFGSRSVLASNNYTVLSDNMVFTSAGAAASYLTTGFATMYLQGGSTNGQHQWYTAPSGTAGNAISYTQAMTLDASGNLGIGTSSPSYTLHLNSAASLTNIGMSGGAAGATNYKIMQGVTGVTNSGFSLYDTSSSATRLVIDSSGNLLVGTTSASTGNGGFRVRINNGGTSGYTNVQSEYSSASSTYSTWDVYAGSAYRFYVTYDGGVHNYQANDTNLSDRREKTNFAPAKSYLDTICAIPVQTFNYIDQNLEDDPGLTLGVVAQDVQAVAPELVMESNWGTEDEPKMRLSIYQTDLQYALMKCIQEQQAIIESLTARIAALESK